MIDRNGETWRDVVAHVEAEIEKARAVLEMAGLDPIATEHERGRVAALRSVLALGKEDSSWSPLPKVDYMNI